LYPVQIFKKTRNSKILPPGLAEFEDGENRTMAARSKYDNFGHSQQCVDSSSEHTGNKINVI
jgi:hypothetical protein